MRRERRRTVVVFHRPFYPSISSSPNNDSSARSACAMRGRGRRRYKKRTRGTHGKGEERKQGSRSPAAAAAAPASSQHLLARMCRHGNVSLSSLLRKKSPMMNRTSADSKPPESNQIRVFFFGFRVASAPNSLSITKYLAPIHRPPFLLSSNRRSFRWACTGGQETLWGPPYPSKCT